jgi:hypothetical protein
VRIHQRGRAIWRFLFVLGFGSVLLRRCSTLSSLAGRSAIESSEIFIVSAGIEIVAFARPIEAFSR